MPLRRLLRRPSPSMVVALIALFVALGGPATAARLIDGGSIRRNSITSAQIRNRTIRTADLAARSVGEQQLQPSSVTPAKLATGSVTASKIADAAVGSAAILDGGLQTRDIGDFYGSVQIAFTSFGPQDCQVGTPFAPQPAMPSAGAVISDDVIVVTPPVGWPDQLTVSGRPGAGNTLRVVVCNPTATAIAIPPNVPPTFQYLGIDQP